MSREPCNSMGNLIKLNMKGGIEQVNAQRKKNSITLFSTPREYKKKRWAGSNVLVTSFSLLCHFPVTSFNKEMKVAGLWAGFCTNSVRDAELLASAINLDPVSQLGSINLPLDIGRVTLNQDESQSSIYMILQPMGRTATSYCYECGELLPRLFTLTLAGGHSLLRYLNIAAHWPLTSMVPCAARTFLPCYSARATDCPAAFTLQR